MTPPILFIRLLGACEIHWQGRSYPVARRQTRALLYRLAAAPGILPRSELAFLFWPDTDEAAARRQLTRLVSSLRAALPAPELLLVTEEAVGLNQEQSDSDARRLLAAAGSADLATLQAVADRCAGTFMAGFALPDSEEYETWQAETARHMEFLCLQTLERLVDLHTAGDNRQVAISYASAYLQKDPLAETMHRRLIALHVAVGDRSAAIRQYERCALVLEKELGVSPLPETRAALQAAPAEPAAAPTAVQGFPPVPLVGRQAELDRLESACSNPSGGLILISGEPGIGKSRLIAEFTAGQAGRRLVLNGSAFQGSQALPFHPLLQALGTAARRDEFWQHIPTFWQSELVPLLPELRSRTPDLPNPMPPAPGQAQARLLAALTQAFQSVSSATPVLLTLDDLQWADEATLAWLQFLHSTWHDGPLHILAAVQNYSAPQLAGVRQAYLRSRRLVEIELGGLQSEDVRVLLTPLIPPTGWSLEFVNRIHAVSSGNPFFLLEIVRDLQEAGQDAFTVADLPLPESVRSAILGRLGRLSPGAVQILEAAAVLDPQLEDSLLQYTSGRSPGEISDGMDELHEHQLLAIENKSSEVKGWTRLHSLVQKTVYQGLTPWRRRLLHRRAVEALTHRQDARPAVLARHAAGAEDWDAAVRHIQEAADQAAQASGYETALDLVDQALDLFSQTGLPDSFRMGLLRRRLALHQVLVRLPGWEADIAEVLRLAVITGDSAARLDALEARISLHVLQSDFPELEPTANEALILAQQTGNRVAEARIMHKLGWHLADVLGRSREGLGLLSGACRLAEASGARSVLYEALCSQAFVLRADGQCRAALETALQALALTSYEPGASPRPEFADAQRELGEAHAYLAHWEAAWRLLRPLLELYQTLNDPWNFGAVLHNHGLYCSQMGQHSEAIAAMSRLVELSTSVGLAPDSDYGIWHRSGLVRVLLAAGEIAKAGRLLKDLQTEKLTPGRPYLAWVRAAAEHSLVGGDFEGALSILRPAVDWWRSTASLHDTDVLLLLAQALRSAGDQEAAAAAVTEAGDLLEPTDLARHRLRLFWMRWLVNSDPADLAVAQDELAEQAARFSDPALREAFLKQVSLNRQIAAA